MISLLKKESPVSLSELKKLKEKDLIQAALDPKELGKKIDPAQDLVLYLSVNNYVPYIF